MGNASRLATPDWDAEALQNLMMSLLGLPPECLTHPADKAVLIQHLNTAHRDRKSTRLNSSHWW